VRRAEEITIGAHCASVKLVVKGADRRDRERGAVWQPVGMLVERHSGKTLIVLVERHSGETLICLLVWGLVWGLGWGDGVERRGHVLDVLCRAARAKRRGGRRGAVRGSP
jgi:hypothetical protein